MSLSRLAVLLLLLGSLEGCQAPPRQSLDLARLFSQTVRGPLLAPTGEIGEPQASAFLSGRWERSQERPYRALLGKGGFRFYASEPVSTRILLEGRASRPGQASLELNGVPLPSSVALDSQWSRTELDLEAGQVREGLNTLYVLSPSPTTWRRFEARPRGLGRDVSGADLGPYAQDGQPASVSIPFASSLVYPLILPAGGALVFDKIEPWLENGAAPLGQWSLSVRLQADEPEFDQQWLINTTSPRLEFPSGVSEESCLTLTPWLDTPPLPGQIGLTLLAPRIDSDQAPELARNTPPYTQAMRSPAAGQSRPNVILFLVDTLRADHLSCYGYARPTSPHFDRLAREGVLFEDVTAESSWTKPSTATILTGLPSLQHGVQDFADILPAERRTLGEIFADHGYQAAAFMTNPLASPIFKFDQGCETSIYRRLARADRLIDEVDRWLEARQGEAPFFLYIHTMDPHLPYAPPADLARPWRPKRVVIDEADLAQMEASVLAQEKADGSGPIPEELSTLVSLYDGEVAANDRAFGRLVEGLKKRGLYDNTVIAVVSDHGEEMFERRGFGHVHSLYQELVHVPWILKLPGSESAGLRVKANWRHLDTAPTLLALARVPIPSEMKGRVFQPELAEESAPAAFSYVHTGRGAVATRQAQYPYLLEAEGLRLGRYQLITTQAQLLNKLQPVELYDLVADPEQKMNLASQRPATALHLRRLASQIRGEIRGRARAEKRAPQLPASQVRDSLRGLEYLR